jgi:diguanylate cyclase (GGDEF)-like protein
MSIAAAAATVSVWRAGASLNGRLTIAAALTFAPMLMVYAGAGAWQVDWHMYFFVVFGLLVAYVDWRPIALSAGLTTAHHVVLNFLLPTAVFPESDLARDILHGAIVVADVVVLFWIIDQMKSLLRRIESTNGVLEERIGERTAEVNVLNTALEKQLHEVEDAFARLETEVVQRREIADRLDHLAHHDVVTGLPNRVLLVDRLSVAVSNAARSGNNVLVVYLDIDEFKQINDTLGHSGGDQVLQSIAARLRACLRPGDTASRVGGDEFVCVCSLPDAAGESEALAERFLAAVSETMQIGSYPIRFGASIGMSMYPADGSDPEQLIAMADAAMVRAKQADGGRFQIYTPEIHADMLAKSTLKRELEAALIRDEFVVFYQPIVNLNSNAVVGAEALVRWQHPTRGLLAPGEFIAFAEQNGFIAEIGDVVARKACAQLNRFELEPSLEFTMAVNVSAIQFRQPGFAESIKSLVAQSEIESSRLEVEITESVIVDHTHGAINTLGELKELGVKLSIDDFGTGYSSLAYLKTFPVQTLKIDRSFVIDIATSTTDQAIAATIITLAHSLRMRVIAEGVETPQQLDQLRRLGADNVQGYLLSRPLASRDFERYMCSHGLLRLAA